MSLIGNRASGQIVTSGQSLGSSFQTSAVDMSDYYSAYFQCNWVGSPAGTLIVQGSGDGVNFEDLDMTPLTLAGADGAGGLDIIATGAPWLRVSFVYGSGSGSIDITSNRKKTG